MVEDNLVVGVKLDKSSSIRPVIPVSMLKPIGSPFGRNGNYLVPRNLAKKSTSDVWGPAPVQTINSRKYYGSFTDYFS